MIQYPTVLVLGAGASEPYGLPIGHGLVENILRDSTPENGPFRVMLRNCGRDDREVGAFLNALRQTQFDSIDVFLEHQPDFREVGKLAIATALLPCEQEPSLLKPTAVNKHWYRLLFNQFVRSDGFSAARLTVITLNYDRSIEAYLLKTVGQEFRLDEQAAARLVRSCICRRDENVA
jgi:hypothetical protein